MNYLREDRRNDLVALGRRGKREKGDGKTRYEKRVKSRVASSVKEFNSIDMTNLFKHGILTVNVPVVGETNSYTVRIRFGSFLDELQQQIERQNGQLNLRAVTRALLDAFNRDDVYISCTCLHPDTRIKLLDGTSPTVVELCARIAAGEALYGYSVDEKGDFIPNRIVDVWQTGESSELIEVTLDNSETVVTTPTHRYLGRDGQYYEAQELQVGQSLMPLYFESTPKGYETVRFNSTGRYHSTYKCVAQHYWSEEIEMAEQRSTPEDGMRYNVAIHHKDFNKLNNNPENLQVMTAREHWDYHAKLCGPDRHISDHAREVSRQNALKRNANPTPAMIETRRRFQAAGTARNYDEDRRLQQSQIMKHNIQVHSAWRSEQSKEQWQRGCYDTEAFHQAARKRGELLRDPATRQASQEGIQKYRQNMSADEREHRRIVSCQNILKAQEATRGIKRTAEQNKRRSEARLQESDEVRQQRILRCAHTKIKKILMTLLNDGLAATEENFEHYRKSGDPTLLNYFDSVDEAVRHFKLNHKVVAIKHIKTESSTPVYDIRMEGVPNFLTAAGAILHNCADWKYRGAYWATVGKITSGAPETRISKITNPDNDLGPGCKHIMLVLANNSWLIKVASVILNYVIYMERNQKKLYADIIYPAIYGKKYEDPVQLSLDDKDELDTDSTTLDAANAEGRVRGQFKQGNQYRYQPKSGPGKGQIDVDSIIIDEE